MGILKKPTAWEAVYSVAMALACLISYAATTELSKVAAQWHADPIAGLWAAVSTAFVFRDTRQRSLNAGIGRLAATCVSFSLCLPYLWLFPASLAGMAILLALGTLLMMQLNRRDDIVTTAVTTVVVMVVAMKSPTDAWKQPILRLVETVIGVGIGMGGKWLASFAFYRTAKQPIQ